MQSPEKTSEWNLIEITNELQSNESTVYCLDVILNVSAT